MIGRRAAALASSMTIAVACSTYETAEVAPPPDRDASTSAVADASATVEAGPDRDGGIPRGSCNPDAKKVDLAAAPRIIHQPASAEATAFGIVADAAHVYWLEQSRLPGQITDVYNGMGSSRLLRKPLTAGPSSDAEVLLTGLGKVRHLALLDGDLFFLSDKAPEELTRVSASCKPPCATSLAGVLNSASRVAEIIGAGRERLALVSQDGLIVAYETGTLGSRGAVGSLPALAYAGGAVYASSAQYDEVRRFMPDSDSALTPFAKLPAIGAESPGAHQLAADCSAIYAYRGDRWLWRSEIASPTFTKWIAPGAGLDAFSDVYDLQSDGDFVYAASTNAGGVIAIDRTNGAQHTLYTGNVWHLAVTDSAVLWGEHAVADGRGGGIIYALDKK